MANTLSPSEFHKQYTDILSSFQKHIPNARERVLFVRDIDEFLRHCTIGVWHAGEQSLSPVHVEYYNAIYCDITQAPSILFWELVSRADQYPGFQIPALFQRLCQYDLQSGQGTSRRFIYDLSLLLLLFASVDGSVSAKEAAFIQSSTDSLSALCQETGLPESGPTLTLSDFIQKPAPSMDRPLPSETGTSPAPPIQEKEEGPEENLDELLAQLDELCGLQKIKEEVHSLINLMKVRKLREENNLPVPPMSLHMVFMGNPGTGKTTVARLLARLYKAIGVLSTGQLVEVDRSGLVAGFVGQTALKTREVIQKSLGGILFIDEAYSLSNQENSNDFGQEAIEILLKGMEDHRHDLVVIVAGYTKLMGKFISSNPGLESRFNKYLYFEDYTGPELMDIFRSTCKKHCYRLTSESETLASRFFDELYTQRDENFGNARDVRNVFEHAIARQANRLATLEHPGKEDLMPLLPSDLEFIEEEGPPA